MAILYLLVAPLEECCKWRGYPKVRGVLVYGGADLFFLRHVGFCPTGYFGANGREARKVAAVIASRTL